MKARRERDERLQIMLSAEELAALEELRFTHRLPSRASAIREILRRGLIARGLKAPDSQRQSRDFGVLGTGSNRRPKRGK
jgi:hypothetical protein